MPEPLHPDDLRTICSRLVQARKEASLTQDEVGHILGVPKDTVSRWERGKNDPGFSQIARLAEIYGASLDWIAGTADHKSGLKSGHAIVDTETFKRLEQAVAHGQSLRSMRDSLAPPGIRCIFDIPAQHRVVNGSEARAFHQKVQQLTDKLKRSDKP